MLHGIKYRVTKVNRCFEYWYFFHSQGAAQSCSRSYKGEQATKDRKKRTLQNTNKFMLHGT